MMSAERCDYCGMLLGENGLWVQEGRRVFKFCSTTCMNAYDRDLFAGSA